LQQWQTEQFETLGLFEERFTVIRCVRIDEPNPNAVPVIFFLKRFEPLETLFRNRATGRCEKQNDCFRIGPSQPELPPAVVEQSKVRRLIGANVLRGKTI
jgi:hypothetical protein